MKNLLKPLSVVVGLGILALVMVLMDSRSVGAQSQQAKAAAPVLNANAAIQSIPVRVTNTPLPVQGTESATIKGTPNVNATIQDRTGPRVGDGDRRVDVRDVDDPANHPFVFGGCFSPTNTPGRVCPAGDQTLTVPGSIGSIKVKALVIEFVSGTCSSVPLGEPTAVAIAIRLPDGSGPYGHYFVPVLTEPVLTESSSGDLEYAFSQDTRIYAPAGSTIQIGANYNTASNPNAPPPLFCVMTIDGHYATE